MAAKTKVLTRTVIDPGYSNLKWYNEHGGGMVANFSSNAAGGRRYADLGGGSNDISLIEWENGKGRHQLYVGEDAVSVGTPNGDLGMNRLVNGDEEMKAVLFAGLSQAFPTASAMSGEHALHILLPVKLMQDAEATQNKERIKAWLSGNHEWTAGINDYSIYIKKVEFHPQAMAAVHDYTHGADGDVIPEHEDAYDGFTVILSCGHLTMEVLTLLDGAPMHRFTDSVDAGMVKLVQMVDGGMRGIPITNARMRKGKMDGEIAQNMNGWGSNARSRISEVIAEIQGDVSTVLITGGGLRYADGAVINQLQPLFRCPIVRLDDDFASIARGGYKLVKAYF